MKALSVRQPYAELIARGVKSIEVRTWPTDYRGPLLIVASSNAWREDMPKFGLTDRDCPRSVAVCVVDLERIVKEICTSWSDAACCEVQRGDQLWRLVNPRRVAPFPVKGKLRLFDIPDETIRIARGAVVGVPPCAASMGCLCAGHARGNAPSATCDTRE